MIVKNESHIIEKTLEHLTTIFNFSYWVICDTGSTDNTQNIIKDFFNKKNINGELLEHEWKNFGYNRSLALEAVHNKSDYVLIFDADDVVHGNLIIPELKADMYCLKMGKDFVYKRPLLVNNRLKWKFVGVLHEFLSCIDNLKTEEVLEGDYHIESGKNGSRSFDPDKYLKDAKILEAAYDEEQDVSIKNRYAFYCAQSYMDANMKLKSIEWYKKVTELMSWNQEKYYACLMIAKQLEGLISELNTQIYNYEIIKYLTLADKFDKERMEHKTRLCKFFYDKGIHYLVNSIYLQMRENKNNNLNMNDKLFLDVSDYYNQIEYYNSISAFYTGDLKNGYDCCLKIILDNNIFDKSEFISQTQYRKNEHYFHSSIHNLHFYLDILKSETNDTIIQNLFQIVNSYIQTEPNDNLLKIWNILFNKIDFCEFKYYEKTNETKPIVFLSMTTCKRIDLFEKTINSILNNWLDYDKIDYWFCVDDNSCKSDREIMKNKYPFFEFYFKNIDEKGHRNSMNIIWEKINELKPKYWIHLEDDFLFFDKMEYVSESIKALESMSDKNVKQILFNRCYAEIIEDYKIKGYIENGNYCIHQHTLDKNNSYLNNHYWPHYSFRPSMVLVEPILSLGNFDSENQFFELDYANKWNNSEYKSAFFNKITNKHIGRLTKDRSNTEFKNAYDLNCENQFSKETKYIKIVNLQRRTDRKEYCIDLFKTNNIENYEFVKAVDGSKLTNDSENLHLFYGNDFGNRVGFIGCALSHYNLWVQLLNDNDNDFYLILEDDVKVSPHFKEIIYKLRNEMKHKPLIYLGYSMYKYQRENLKGIYNVESNTVEINNLDRNLFVGGTFGYSINKDGAKHLLDYINENGITHGIDYIIGKLNCDICYEIKPQICFSEWHETEGIDTDIQWDTNYLTIPEPKNKYKDILSQFIFVKGKDQVNYDELHKKTTRIDAMNIVLNNKQMIGFNTLGFFKNKLENLTPSAYFGETDGIYIKKDIYDNFMNVNAEEQIKESTEKIVEETIEELVEDVIEQSIKNNVNNDCLDSNKKQYTRVKMICAWSSSEQFCREWSNMCETKNTWKDIEITHSDDNVDYYVIINTPYENEYYEPSKTLVFQMEPWVYNNDNNWGVKCWGEWAIPDESKFLYVGTHKKALNNVQWQINVPKQIPSLRQNKAIAVISGKLWDIGHNKRVNFIRYMEKENQNKIDIYGHKNHHSFKNYKGHLKSDKKENHYIHYKYCFAVENNMEYNYSTEKIWESILCECLTFYWGCPNLEDHIDSQAFVRLNLDNFQESMKIINKAIKEDWWSQRIDAIRKEKEKILTQIGFFPNLKRILNEYENSIL
jgi:GR25 family glycosyltransferase involved in LPS biosynthesis/glycosyltransferase involved in cell wall biosynthesis